MAVLARLFTLGLGLAAIAWGADVLPILWRQAPVERIAGYTIDRASFKPGALLPLLPAVAAVEQDPYCRPEALHSAALIRLRLVDDAMAAGAGDTIDPRLEALQTTTRRSLACAPADPFLWMVLAWVDVTRNGLRPGQLQDLRLSYLLGPNEGWIAARRNRFALSMFGRLSPDLADAAINEFAGMVDSWIYGDSIAIFTSAPSSIQHKLLARLAGVGKLQREAFAKALYERGYDVTVPGVTPRDPRPWY
jgi:hypothetical protein